MIRAVFHSSLLLVSMVIAGACSVGTTSSPDGSSPVDSRSDPATPSDPGCYGADVTFDGPPKTIDQLAKLSDRVVVARVEGVEAGFFNTVDHKRPDSRRAPGFPGPMIFTPYILQVTNPVAGSTDEGLLRAVVRGGEADCITYNVYPQVAIDLNQTYVVFMQPSSDAEGERHPELRLILAAWPIDAEGMVQTEEDGLLPIDDLSRAVTEAAN